MTSNPNVDIRRRTMLGDFLRTRRARLRPEQIGVPTSGGRRRTPGLRREEVAEQAGVSVEWYTWIEQGRDIHVSSSVLQNIARALRLSADEQLYLAILTTPAALLPDPFPAGGTLESYQQMIEALPYSPAYITNRMMDVVAWNRAADLVFGQLDAVPAGERNFLQLLFLDHDFRQRFDDWDSVAQGTVAGFRITAGRQLDSPKTAQLIATLSQRSQAFRQLWSQHDVQNSCAPQRTMLHPLAGALRFTVLSFQIGGDPDLRCCVHTPADPPTAAALSALLPAPAKPPLLGARP
ncbi:helix-turn-helix domain-containing protein [Chloroflexia bacterium SDU3-3]|nr:helix-turn-helix domain-containing protein [Chloroflexia bacterium SDU3-3]